MLTLTDIQRVLNSEGNRMIAQIQANMISEGVNATGETSDSLEHETTKYVDGFRF